MVDQPRLADGPEEAGAHDVVVDAATDDPRAIVETVDAVGAACGAVLVAQHGHAVDVHDDRTLPGVVDDDEVVPLVEVDVTGPHRVPIAHLGGVGEGPLHFLEARDGPGQRRLLQIVGVRPGHREVRQVTSPAAPADEGTPVVARTVVLVDLDERLEGVALLEALPVDGGVLGRGEVGEYVLGPGREANGVLGTGVRHVVGDESRRIGEDPGLLQGHVVAIATDVSLDERAVLLGGTPVGHGSGKRGVVRIVRRFDEGQRGDRGELLAQLGAKGSGGCRNLTGGVEVGVERGEPGREVEARHPGVSRPGEQGAIK